MKIFKKKIQNLRSVGPVVEVSFYDMKSPSNPVKGLALIDTGATCSCIDKDVAERLNLIMCDKLRVYSPTGNMLCDVFDVEMTFTEMNLTIDCFVLNAHLAPQPYIALIGRDVLGSFKFSYDGKENSYSLNYLKSK